jgi:hypothetical protein
MNDIPCELKYFRGQSTGNATCYILTRNDTDKISGDTLIQL